MESLDRRSRSPSADIDEDDELDTHTDDKSEDAGELDLSAAQNELFLTRMPKITWEALSALKDDDEIQVGTLRIQGDRQNPAKVSLMLDPKVSAFQLVPREYNMRTTNKSSSNTFVFTEKDLPGYTRKVAGQGTQGSRPQPLEKKEGNGNRRAFRMPGYRKAIPKKTALTGSVRSEFNCLPVENQEYVNILSRRQVEMPKGPSAPAVMEGRVGMANALNPGGVGATNSFSGFIRAAPPREKKQQLKAARIPENELIDMILACFRRFKYWPFHSLRAETEQPGDYLRKTLEGIAEPVKTGPQSGKWRLKADMIVDWDAYNAAAEAAAPGVEGASEPEDEGYVKTEVKMEDAK